VAPRRRWSATISAPRLRPQPGVEVGQRLVHQEGRRSADHGAGQRHPLPLPARELRRAAVQQGGKAERPGDRGHLRRDGVARGGGARQQPPHERHAPRRGQPSHFQRKRDVLPHRHVGVEGIGLEHHRQVAGLGRQRVHAAGTDADLPRVGAFQPRQDAQEGGLTAAGRAEDGEELAFRRFERNAAQHLGRAEPLADAHE
jgi:hypothetical protein